MKSGDYEARMETRALKPKLSVIVPVYNERKELNDFLNWWESLPYRQDMELVICAAKTFGRDEIVAAKESGARILRNIEPSRALQMNSGAEAAKGDRLFFMHVDSRAPANFPEVIAETLSRPGCVAGVFSHRFRESGDNLSLALISRINRLRYSLTGIYYGDQGLFLNAEVFRKIGSFDNLPLMEDVGIVKKLRKLGRVICLKQAMKTSGRRFLKNGPWKTFFTIWLLLLRDFLGFDLSKQSRIYRESG